MSGKAEDLAGRRFGWLVAKERAGTDGRGHAVWRCVCGCGGETIVPAYTLKGGNTTSCGCKRAQRMKKAHAQARAGKKSSYVNIFDNLDEFLSS